MTINFKSPEDFNKLLLKSGYTQGKFSTKINRFRGYISSVTDRGVIRADGAKAICDALGVEFDEIFIITT